MHVTKVIFVRKEVRKIMVLDQTKNDLVWAAVNMAAFDC